MSRSPRRRPVVTAVAVLLVVLLVVLTALEASAATIATGRRTAGVVVAKHKPVNRQKVVKKAPAPLTGAINVFAAASLAEAFREEAAVFHFLAPKTTVNLNVGASSTLAAQVIEGAPADLFASADEANMRKVSVADALASDSHIVAHNRLTILVPKGNPANITQLSDLAKPGVKVSLCAETVPCGRFAKQILGDAKVPVTPVSFESDVKGVVTKVSLGEVDAGITYVTDAFAAAATTRAVRIPDENNVINAYPIAITRAVQDNRVASVFLLFLFTPLGQSIMRKHGFLPY